MADSQTPQPPSGSEHLTPAPATEDNIKPDPDLDASIEQDVDMNTEHQPGVNTDDAPAPGMDPIEPAPQPSKKETSLREFLGKMDDYAPIVSLSQHSHQKSLYFFPCVI
jgi:transcription initiation factor TFIID subunit 10